MRAIATVAVSIALLVPPTALAASSTCQAYNPQLCGTGAGTQSAGTQAGGANSNASGSSALPFTGLDLLLLAVGGSTLLAAGLVVRILLRPSSTRKP